MKLRKKEKAIRRQARREEREAEEMQIRERQLAWKEGDAFPKIINMEFDHIPIQNVYGFIMRVDGVEIQQRLREADGAEAFLDRVSSKGKVKVEKMQLVQLKTAMYLAFMNPDDYLRANAVRDNIREGKGGKEINTKFKLQMDYVPPPQCPIRLLFLVDVGKRFDGSLKALYDRLARFGVIDKIRVEKAVTSRFTHHLPNRHLLTKAVSLVSLSYWTDSGYRLCVQYLRKLSNKMRKDEEKRYRQLYGNEGEIDESIIERDIWSWKEVAQQPIHSAEKLRVAVYAEDDDDEGEQQDDSDAEDESMDDGLSVCAADGGQDEGDFENDGNGYNSCESDSREDEAHKAGVSEPVRTSAVVATTSASSSLSRNPTQAEGHGPAFVSPPLGPGPMPFSVAGSMHSTAHSIGHFGPGFLFPGAAYNVNNNLQPGISGQPGQAFLFNPFSHPFYQPYGHPYPFFAPGLPRPPPFTHPQLNGPFPPMLYGPILTPSIAGSPFPPFDPSVGSHNSTLRSGTANPPSIPQQPPVEQKKSRRMKKAMERLGSAFVPQEEYKQKLSEKAKVPQDMTGLKRRRRTNDEGGSTIALGNHGSETEEDEAWDRRRKTVGSRRTNDNIADLLAQQPDISMMMDPDSAKGIVEGKDMGVALVPGITASDSSENDLIGRLATSFNKDQEQSTDGTAFIAKDSWGRTKVGGKFAVKSIKTLGTIKGGFDDTQTSAGTDKDQGDTVDLLTEKTLPFAKILPAAFIRFSTSALPNDITDLSPNEYIIVNYEGEPFPESGLPVIKEEEEMDVDGKEEEKGGVDAGV